MESILIKAAQLILSLSLLVIIHEFGHFIFARMFKVRVEKFYLFFNPWFSLFKFKPKNSETEYGIGWLPLGGYVKIAGMIDESMDKEQMSQPVQPWEFRSKPAGQRLAIMVAGVVFNFIAALLIYAAIAFTWGDKYIPLNEAKLGMDYNQAAIDAGFQNGDILLTVDGTVMDKSLSPEVVRLIGEAKTVVVQRDGQLVKITLPEDFMNKLIAQNEPFANYRFPMVVQGVVAGSGAEKGGMQSGDSIFAINGIKTPSYTEISQALTENKSGGVYISVYRGLSTFNLPVEVDANGKIGIQLKGIIETMPVKEVQYGLFESIPVGIDKGVNKLKGYVSDMKYLFTKEGAKQLGGFGTIASIFPDQWNWQAFWEMTAFLSIILAFMNILPIPALDGGHVLFLLYEVITRRKPSDKFMEYAQTAGMILLFGLLIYANGNDLFRFLFK